MLVVGLGCAGAAAALEASRGGAETLVLERAGGGGGTSAMSGGVLYLGGGTALQKACGFEDSPGEMEKYLLASCGEASDAEKIRLYCEGSIAHYDWIVEQGVPFKQVFYEGCSGEPPTDDGLVWSGSERAHPFREIAVPAPRGHVPQMVHQTGPLLMQKLCEAVDASPARVAANHRCVALVQEPDGSVIGAVAETFGERRAIRARRGLGLLAGRLLVFFVGVSCGRRCQQQCGEQQEQPQAASPISQVETREASSIRYTRQPCRARCRRTRPRGSRSRSRRPPGSRS